LSPTDRPLERPPTELRFDGRRVFVQTLRIFGSSCLTPVTSRARLSEYTSWEFLTKVLGSSKCGLILAAHEKPRPARASVC